MSDIPLLHSIANDALVLVPRIVGADVPVTFVQDGPKEKWCGTMQNHDYSIGSEPDDPTVRLRVPVPDTPECLFILLHEVGHLFGPRSVGPVTGLWIEMSELSASFWAAVFMEARGVPVPNSTRVLAPLLAHDQRLLHALATRARNTAQFLRDLGAG